VNESRKRVPSKRMSVTIYYRQCEVRMVEPRIM